MMSVGLEIPETRINKEDPPIYALPPRYLALGAYPAPHGAVCIAPIAKGCGVQPWFSRLYLDEDKANFQLHTWEYLIAEELIGYVVSESRGWNTSKTWRVRLQTR